MAAITACKTLGIDLRRIALAFMKMDPVKGRFNVIDGGKKVIIDFAHTPDGLKNLLKAARRICSGKLIAVFGCGGNRDTKKRAVMGRIAAEYADFTVITSDNSRDENPEDIIAQIEQGYRGNKQRLYNDSRQGARHNLRHFNRLAAGCHCNSRQGRGGDMEVKGIKIPYSDKKVVEEIFGRYNL